MRQEDGEADADSGGAAAGPLEDHVLQKMGDAGNIGLLVARAGADKESQRHRPRRGADLANDMQTVRQYLMMKGHGNLPG